MLYSSIRKTILSLFVCLCLSSSFATADTIPDGAVISEARHCGKTVRALIRNYDILHLNQNLKNGEFLDQVCSNISAFADDINDFRHNCCSSDFLSAMGPLGQEFSGACMEIKSFTDSDDVSLDLGLGYLCGTRSGTCEGTLSEDQRAACHCGVSIKPLLSSLGSLGGIFNTIVSGGNLSHQFCRAFPNAFSSCACCRSGLATSLKGAIPSLAGEVDMLSQICQKVDSPEGMVFLVFAWAISCNIPYPNQCKN